MTSPTLCRRPLFDRATRALGLRRGQPEPSTQVGGSPYAQRKFQPQASVCGARRRGRGPGRVGGDARRHSGSGGCQWRLARCRFGPVPRCDGCRPDRRRVPADLRLLERNQPAVDVDGRQPVDGVRQQVPGCSGPRHHGRYPGTDLDLFRRREPAVAGELRRHGRRRGVRAVPGGRERRYGQRHGGAVVDVQRWQQPEVDRSDRDTADGRHVFSSVDVPLDVDGCWRSRRTGGPR